MTDRELLEAAARAAGNGATWYRGFGMGISEDAAFPKRWDPLTDDGDALRLAVKLRISILFNPDDSVCAACGTGDGTDESEATPESTRRAIVRAAAALADK